MSLLSYNTVVLPFPYLTRFDQEAVWEDSGTDFYLSRFNIGCRCVVNSNYLPLLAPSLVKADGTLVTTNPADIQNIIYQKLMTPRSALSLKMNGVDLIPTSVGGGTPDAKSGPHPQRCTFTTLTNTSFIMQWDCIAHYWINNKQTNANAAPVTNQAGNQVLYNRWTEVQDIDDCNRSTYTRTGKFVIRSDNPQGNIADEMRNQMAVVGVRPNFLRKSSRYGVDKSGLAIEYTVVDKEVFKKPPTPAFKAKGRYTETIGADFGAKRHILASVKLEGDNETDQMALIEAAIRVVSAKIALRLGGQGLTLVEQAILNFELYDNEVDFTAGGWLACDTNRKNGITGFTRATANTKTPFYDPAYQPPYLSRGTGNILLHAAAYYDPNLVGVIVDDNGQMTAGKEPGRT